MTRKELSQKIGVNVLTIGNLEREGYNPSLDLAFRISECFGLLVEVISSTQPMRPLSEKLYLIQKHKGDKNELA